MRESEIQHDPFAEEILLSHSFSIGVNQTDVATNGGEVFLFSDKLFFGYRRMLSVVDQEGTNVFGLQIPVFSSRSFLFKYKYIPMPYTNITSAPKVE